MSHSFSSKIFLYFLLKLCYYTDIITSKGGFIISVTLKDIAQETGLSLTTVSLVLNNKPASIPENTRKIVLDTSARMGYIRKRKSQNLALLVPNLQNPFFSDLARQILIQVKEYGFNLIISDSNNSCDNDIDDLLTFVNAGVSGIIAFFSTDSQQDARLRQVLKQITEKNHVPVILMDRNKPEYNCDAVCINQFASGYIATQYLLNMGHTNIGCISGPNYSEAGCQRLDGYRSALEEAGIPYRPDFVTYGSFTYDFGYECLPQLLNKGVSAIFAQSDFIALGVYHRARELNLCIPRDLSLVGLDNILYTELIDPPLTSVAQDISRISQLAIDTLINRINGTAEANRQIHILQPELVIRKSVSKYKPKKQKPAF